MKIKSVSVIILSLLVICNISCFDDKGNYDYKDIKEAQIISIPGISENDRLICFQNDQLEIKPEIKFGAGMSAADYDFEWYRYPKSPQGAPGNYEQGTIISTSQNLEYKVADSPRNFWCNYTITNKKSGAISEYRFEFIVSAVNGWALLTEDQSGKFDISVITDEDILEVGDGQVVRDYISQMNNGLKMDGTRFVGFNSYDDHIYVYSNTGMYTFSGATYILQDVGYESRFHTNILNGVDPQAHHLDNKGGYAEMVINNGSVFVMAHRMMGGNIFSKATGTGVESYRMAPYIAPISVTATNCAVFYDVENSRFVSMETWGTLRNTLSGAGVFNPGSMDPNLELISLGEGKNGITCGIFRKKESGVNQTWLYRVNLLASEPAPIDCVQLKNMPGIDEAKHFAFGLRGDYMFYAFENGVYKHVYGSETTSEKVLTVASGDEIIDMKMFSYISNEEYHGKILFIATWNGSEGKVYKYSFEDLTGDQEKDVKVYDGFGKIHHMIYKY